MKPNYSKRHVSGSHKQGPLRTSGTTMTKGMCGLFETKPKRGLHVVGLAQTVTHTLWNSRMTD